MKLCVDCKHYKVQYGRFGLSTEPVCKLYTETVNPVYGTVRYYDCYRIRGDWNKCGPDAVKFEKVELTSKKKTWRQRLFKKD